MKILHAPSNGEGIYGFVVVTNRKGKKFQVQIELHDENLRWLAKKAMSNKTQQSSAADGALIARVVGTKEPEA